MEYPAPVHPCIASLLHPLILPLVASASAESVPVAGLPAVVPAVLRPHVPTVHAAHMALFCTSHVQPGPGCSDVGGIDGCPDDGPIRPTGGAKKSKRS